MPLPSRQCQPFLNGYIVLQHIYLVKGSDDPNTYLVNDTADPLQRSLTCLELTDVLMGAPPPGASATWAPPTGQLSCTLAFGPQATGTRSPALVCVKDTAVLLCGSTHLNTYFC